MIKCGHCGALHRTVALVRACAEGEKLVPRSLRSFTEQDERDMQRMEAEGDRAETYREERAKADWKASVETAPALSLRDKLELVDRMLVTREVPSDQWRWSRAVREMISGNGTVTEFALDTAIARLEAFPEMAIGKIATSAPRVAASVAGLYRLDGRLYQVIFNKKGTQLYAKLVVFPPADSLAKRPTLTYAPGVISRLQASDLVPAEEAQELTRKTGWCVFGHFLTDPKSIKRGMGPKCWAKYGATAEMSAA